MKKRNNFFRSLRFRILIILIILGIVPGVIVTYTMLHNYQDRAVSMLSERVSDQCDILCNLIIKENYLNDTDSETVNSKLELFSNVYNGRVLLADRDFKIVSDTFHTEEGKTLLSSLAVSCLKDGISSNYDAKNKVLELAVPVQSPDVQQFQGVMLVTVSAIDIAETLTELEQRGVMLIGIIIVLAGFLAWLLSTILVKPLARVTKSIEDLTDGVLDEEISVPDYTETELITDAFNKMVNRMRILDESRQEFVSNVSHELKTPIALIQGYAEGLQECINDDDQSREFYCEVIVDEAGKMNQMVKKLLTLNQLEFGNDTVAMERFDLTDLVSGVVQSARLLAEQKGAEIHFNQTEPVYVWGDEFKMEEVVTNYVSNALNHVDYEKKIEIKTEIRQDTVRLSVFNTGDVIPEEDLDKVWVKFYKVDKARTREYGGSGIGLSIVKAIMDSMHQKCGVKNYSNGVEFWFELSCADGQKTECQKM